MVLDVETVMKKGVLPYDIGYKIIDTRTKETLCSKSLAIWDIFKNKNLLNSAYYAEKIPHYYEELKLKIRRLVSFVTAKHEIYTDLELYHVKRVFAYNANFDINALNTANHEIAGNPESFFPKNIEIGCIWHCACQVLLNSKYIKFCIENKYFSNKGTIRTGAEYVYRFITKNVNFEEVHMGLQDVQIETEILYAVYRQKKKMDISPYTGCYRIVQEKYLKYIEQKTIN